ncbi:hypothetical protein Zmor_009040 [Zophobas morio]|uniref:Uncharacterized protein n=1 Tax=Zophobas morio TaxID=2755281 RepID=A0AA38HL28_9CUCU|nr:hypothetical protein Zmor_009040 [Zophobas morio]
MTSKNMYNPVDEIDGLETVMYNNGMYIRPTKIFDRQTFCFVADNEYSGTFLNVSCVENTIPFVINKDLSKIDSAQSFEFKVTNYTYSSSLEVANVDEDHEIIKNENGEYYVRALTDNPGSLEFDLVRDNGTLQHFSSSNFDESEYDPTDYTVPDEFRDIPDENDDPVIPPDNDDTDPDDPVDPVDPDTDPDDNSTDDIVVKSKNDVR